MRSEPLVVAPLRDRGVSGLFTDLTRETSLLIRQEVALAKAEVTEQLGHFVTGSALLIAGGICVFAGFLVLLAAAVLGLALVLPAWLAALAVGAGVLLIGVALLIIGRRALAAQPERTLRRLRRAADRTQELER